MTAPVLSIIGDAPTGLTRCRVCGASDGREVGRVPAVPISLWPTDAPPHPAFDLELHVCERCDHLQLQTMSPDLVSRFYADGVFVEDNSAGHEHRLQVFRERFGADVFTGRTVLDVGGGNNPFVGRIEDAGERWVSDIAVSAAAAAQADKAVSGDFLTADLPERGFDIVTLFHTLEHFAEPAAVVDRLAQIVRPGGLVMIEVPNAEGFTRAVPHYAVFHQHQSYFHRASLTWLMARSGFRLEHLFSEANVLLAAFRREENVAASPGRTGPSMGKAIADLRQRIMDEVDAQLREKLGSAQRVAVYGAGGSTTMLLTLLPWLRDRTVGVFDRDSAKHGRYVPGTAVMVGAPDAVDDCGADIVLYLSTALFDLLSNTYRTPGLDVGAMLQDAGRLEAIPAEAESA